MAVVRDILNRVVSPDEPAPDFLKAIVSDGLSDGFVLELAKSQVGETARDLEVCGDISRLDGFCRIRADVGERALHEATGV